jgi:hypothetical protein
MSLFVVEAMVVVKSVDVRNCLAIDVLENKALMIYRSLVEDCC